MRFFGGFILGFICLASYAQVPLAFPLEHPYCTQSEVGFSPCQDTIKFFKRREFYDVGVILPSWLPIIDKTYVAVVEGRVLGNSAAV